jgi:hypothetical protein
MYQIAVPALIRNLQNLAALLEKAAAFADSKKIDPATLAATRLYPNMLPFSKQVQIATDISKGCVARLAGETPPAYPDTETTLAELIERVEKTLDYLRTFKPEQLDSAEDRAIALQTAAGELHFTGAQYLSAFVLPNVYFHVATAYNLLRKIGLDVGKSDFLGALQG